MSETERDGKNFSTCNFLSVENGSFTSEFSDMMLIVTL